VILKNFFWHNPEEVLMGIKFDEETQTWEVSYSKRHPITRLPVTLRRIKIKSKAGANREYNDIVAAVNEKLKASFSATMRYRDILPRFYQSLTDRDLTPKTVENYKLCLEAHTLKLWGGRPIDSITTEEVRQLIKVKLADRSPSHQKSMLKFVRAVFNYSVETRLLASSPVPHMHFRIGDKIKKVLTEQQLKIFLEKAKQFDHEWYPIWVTAVYTGMRNGEIHALTWDKVDLDNRKILVSCSWNKKDGYRDLTKSGDDRIVEIAPALVMILKELKLKNIGSFVLPRIEAWDDGRQAEILRMFLVGINLSPVRFHDLRASWATVMLGKGIEPVKVMNMGGWKDMKTMMIYIRKAGIDIKGITDDLQLHDPSQNAGQVIQLHKQEGE
jgi:integrase